MWAVIILILLLLFFGWLCNEGIKEAERKLGRELTTGELLFGAVTMPYSMLYVLFILPETGSK